MYRITFTHVEHKNAGFQDEDWSPVPSKTVSLVSLGAKLHKLLHHVWNQDLYKLVISETENVMYKCIKSKHKDDNHSHKNQDGRLHIIGCILDTAKTVQGYY